MKKEGNTVDDFDNSMSQGTPFRRSAIHRRVCHIGNEVSDMIKKYSVKSISAFYAVFYL